MAERGAGYLGKRGEETTGLDHIFVICELCRHDAKEA